MNASNNYRKDIWISTAGRVDRQHTYDSFGAGIKQRTVLCVPPSEEAAHVDRGRDVCVCPIENNIGVKRQWIRDNTAGLILMMDDDLCFFKRVTPGQYKTVPATCSDIEDMVARMFSLLRNGYGHVAVNINSNFAVRGTTEDHVFFGKPYSCYGVNTDICRMVNARCVVDLYDDVEIVLRLLCAGYAMPRLVDWAVDCADGSYSNADGGCNTYRDAAVYYRTTKQFLDIFGDYVRTKFDINTISETELFENYRSLGTIQWSKALRASGCFHGDHSSQIFQDLVVRLGGEGGALFPTQRTIHSCFRDMQTTHQDYTLADWEKAQRARNLLYCCTHDAHLQC